MPWVHTATISDGTVKLCCVAHGDSGLNLNDTTISEAWNSNYYKQSRLDLIAGKRIKSCEHCWKEEDAGLRSHRQISNDIFQRHLGEDCIDVLSSQTSNDGSLSVAPITIDFRLGNTCNLQCVMCQPSDSSKWVKPAKQLADTLVSEIKWDWQYKSKIDVSKFDWYKQQQFWTDFDKISSSIKHITFGGGEPLLIKEHKSLIKRLVENGDAKTMKLLYHTNGTIYDQEIVDLWTHFEEVKVMISVDGVGEINDYIRRPSKWKEIEANLRLYDATPNNIVVAINATVQVSNIAHLPAFAQWMLDSKFKKIGHASDSGIYFASLLHWPKYLSIQVLPAEVKKRCTENLLCFIDKNLPNPAIARLKGVVDFMNASDESHLWDKAQEYFEALDALKSN